MYPQDIKTSVTKHRSLIVFKIDLERQIYYQIYKNKSDNSINDLAPAFRLSVYYRLNVFMSSFNEF